MSPSPERPRRQSLSRGAPMPSQARQPVPPEYGTTPVYRPSQTVAGAVASWVACAAGLWLALAPLTIGYAPAGRGFAGFWHDIVFGAAVAVIAATRALVPDHMPVLSLANAGLGVWLVLAPLSLDFTWPEASSAVANVVAVGVVVVAASLTSAALTARNRRGRNRESAPGTR